MLNWILSISLVSLLTTILIIMLPENNNSQIAKFALSLLVILIVIKPLKKAVDFDFNITSSASNDVIFQEEFLDYYSQKKVEYIKESCNIICNEKGAKNVFIDIFYNVLDDNEISIKKIMLNFSNAVFNDNYEHINIIENIENELNKTYNTKIEIVIS